MYFVAFLLDPREPEYACDADNLKTDHVRHLIGFSRKDFLKESINILIGPSGSSRGMTTLSSAQNLYPHAYEKLHTFLRNMLWPMLEVIEDSDDPKVGNRNLRDKGPQNSVSSLSEQINLFWREEYPFRVHDREKIDDPLKWWMDLARHDHANVLGVS